jgi:hypothetical protein
MSGREPEASAGVVRHLESVADAFEHVVGANMTRTMDDLIDGGLSYSYGYADLGLTVAGLVVDQGEQCPHVPGGDRGVDVVAIPELRRDAERGVVAHAHLRPLPLLMTMTVMTRVPDCCT